MGLFDFIKSALDPYTIEQFNYLYNNYYKALELFIRGGYSHPINKMFETTLSYMYLSYDMPYEHKKILVRHRDYIISNYERELYFEKASRLLKDFPNGTTVICFKDFNITISDVPEIAKKALEDYKKTNKISDTDIRVMLYLRQNGVLPESFYKNRITSYLDPQTLTIEEVLSYYSENLAEKESDIKEEEHRLEEKVAQWQKEAENKIIFEARFLARVYPDAYRKLVNFPIETMSLGQAKTTLEYENRIKEYEKEIKERASMPSRVKQTVSSWDTVKGIPHYFFYYYYPTRIASVTSTSDKARKMIWNFKNGSARYEVVSLLKNKLLSTFKPNDLKAMTLVCIPASTSYANKNRYELFSQDICDSLGMKNAFHSIQIVKEKEPSRLGGTSKAEYRFDSSFFKDSYVVLFDDVVTRGHSIEDFSGYLTSMGATIVCAISIGRTCDEYNENVHPFTGTY